MNAHRKVRHTDPAAPVLPTLGDFLAFVAERDKLRAIAAEYNEATAALDDVERELGDMRDVLRKQIDDAARARIDDKQLPVRTTLAKDREELQMRASILHRALSLQSDRLEEAKRPCVEEILAIARPIHAKLMKGVLESAVRLGEALDAEENFRVGLALDGAVSSVTKGAGSVFPAVPAGIKSAVSRHKWSSPLNYLGRAVMGDSWGQR